MKRTGPRLGWWIWLHSMVAAILPMTVFAIVVLRLVPERADELLWRWETVLMGMIPPAAVASWWMSRRIVRPLKKLTTAAAGLAAGRLDTAIPAPAAGMMDEIAELAASLETMRRSVSDRVAELGLLNEVGQAISSAAGLPELLANTARYLTDAAQATGCTLALWDERAGRPELAAACGSQEGAPEIKVVGDLSLAQVVIGNREPMIIRNVQTSTLLEHLTLWPAKSLLAIPLLAQDRAIGAALIGDNRQERDFTPEQVGRAMVIAGAAAVAINNARLNEATQRHLSDLSLLYQTSAAISSTLDEPAVLDMAVQACTRVFSVDLAQLVTVDGEWGRLAAGPRAAAMGPDDGHFPVAGNGLMGWLGANRRPLAIRDARTAPLLYEMRQALAWGDVASVLAVPLVAKNEMLGAILLSALGRPREFLAEEIGLAQTMGNEVASVIQNARLYRQMEEEKRKFELAALNMGEGLIITDAEDRVLFANPQARSLLNWDFGAPLDDPLAAQYPPMALAPLLRRRGEEGDGIVAGEVQIGGPRLTDLSVSMSPVRDDLGVLQWWVMVVHDITRLKELDRLKSEFISTVSHELRTPLASIIGFAELLLTKQPGPLTDVQAEFVGILYRSADQLLNLVNDLLDVSRIETGRFQLYIRTVHPSALVRQVVGSLQPLAETKALRVTLDVPESLPMIAADARRLEQVMNNLLANAIKFTPDGGKVTVSVAEVDEGLRFAVTDTGIGIPPQDIDRVFSRFYRSAESIRKAIGGTGLGLYIAKSIVESHDGRIGLESQEGQGTTVWFFLPLRGPARPTGADAITGG